MKYVVTASLAALTSACTVATYTLKTPQGCEVTVVSGRQASLVDLEIGSDCSVKAKIGELKQEDINAGALSSLLNLFTL